MSRTPRGGRHAGKKTGDPWSLLFSRDGVIPADGEQPEDLVYTGGGSRPMTQQEGRMAFLFWIIGAAAVCLIVALSAVSCAQRPAAESGNVWVIILIAVLAVIAAVIAVNFRRGWKEQKSAEEKKSRQSEAKASLHKE